MTFKEYLKTQDGLAEGILTELHDYLKKLLPQAEFCISYAMPAFKTSEVVVWFAVYKNHLGFYPTGAGVKAFEGRLEGYKYSKGAIQLPLDKALPKQLIKDIVKFRLIEIEKKQVEKAEQVRRGTL